ncbi:TlpA family protein disulfide reductase [Porticoccus sp. GXU_MW_L64]
MRRLPTKATWLMGLSLLAVALAYWHFESIHDQPPKQWTLMSPELTQLKLKEYRLLKDIQNDYKENGRPPSEPVLTLLGEVTLPTVLTKLVTTVDPFELARLTESAHAFYQQEPQSEAGYRAMIFVALWARPLPEGQLAEMSKLRERYQANYNLTQKQVDERIAKVQTLWTEDRRQVLRKKAFDALLKYHLNREELLQVFDDRGGLYEIRSNDEALAFANTLALDSPYPHVRGQYAFAYAEAMILRSQNKKYSESQRLVYEREGRKMAKLVRDKYGDLKALRYGGLNPIRLGNLASAMLALQVGQPMPEVTVNLYNGKLDNLANHRGKVVLFDFWATWCGACIAKFPELMKFQERMAGKPFELILINVDDNLEEAMEFEENVNVPGTVKWYAGPDHDILEKWHIARYPTYFLVDQKNNLQSKFPFDENLKEEIQQLIITQ